jgi:hypothetical protein
MLGIMAFISRFMRIGWKDISHDKGSQKCRLSESYSKAQVICKNLKTIIFVLVINLILFFGVVCSSSAEAVAG